MHVQNNFFNSGSLIEPAAFLALAALAGSKRWIQYFPNASRGGLLLAGGVTGAASFLYDGCVENRSLLNKLLVLSGSALCTYVLAQGLEGRISLSEKSQFRISACFGGVSLLKGVVDAFNEENTPPSSEEKTIRIRAGETTCINYGKDVTGKTQAKITLTDHVYEVASNKGKALLMTEEDFDILKGICHGGAFGGDYCPLTSQDLAEYGVDPQGNKKYMLLWKIPADLTKVESWVVDQSKTFSTADVGTYSLMSDWASSKLSSENQTVLSQIMNQPGKKVRSDFSQSRPPLSSVHHLEILGQTDVPGMSTCFFFQNFNSPKKEEQARVQTFLDALADQDFGAFSCNGMQHMIVIGAYKGGRITPQKLAEFLDTDEGVSEAFLKAFQEAATSAWKGSVENWKDFMIIRYLGTANT